MGVKGTYMMWWEKNPHRMMLKCGNWLTEKLISFHLNHPMKFSHIWKRIKTRWCDRTLKFYQSASTNHISSERNTHLVTAVRLIFGFNVREIKCVKNVLQKTVPFFKKVKNQNIYEKTAVSTNIITNICRW